MQLPQQAPLPPYLQDCTCSLAPASGHQAQLACSLLTMSFCADTARNRLVPLAVFPTPLLLHQTCPRVALLQTERGGGLQNWHDMVLRPQISRQNANSNL